MYYGFSVIDTMEQFIVKMNAIQSYNGKKLPKFTLDIK